MSADRQKEVERSVYRRMTILLVGGGTAGHISPLLAVAHELKGHSKATQIIYVGEKGSSFSDLASSSADIDSVCTIWAGKFRRYANQSLFAKLFDLKTHVLNMRDLLRFVFGVFEAFKIVRANRPNIVFIKGGFVGVPVGLVCRFMRVPYVTHDSDIIPGLANKIIARTALLHAVAMPPERYPYPLHKTIFTGVPVSNSYARVSFKQQKLFKDKVGVPKDSFLIFVTGGSQGAKGLNDIVSQVAADILDIGKDVYLIHQVGRNKTVSYKNIKDKQLKHIIQKDFIANMYEYTGAADVVVSRAGASTIAEMAIQAKACILVPSPHLAGDHQTKNAQFLHNIRAAVLLGQDELKQSPKHLIGQIKAFKQNDRMRQEYQAALHNLAEKRAAAKIADLLLNYNSK